MAAAVDGELEEAAVADDVLLLCEIEHASRLMEEHAESFFLSLIHIWCSSSRGWTLPTT